MNASARCCGVIAGFANGAIWSTTYADGIGGSPAIVLIETS